MPELATATAPNPPHHHTHIDAAPEGGCALGVLEKLVRAGTVARDAEVVLFNTGSGASYRF